MYSSQFIGCPLTVVTLANSKHEHSYCAWLLFLMCWQLHPSFPLSLRYTVPCCIQTSMQYVSLQSSQRKRVNLKYFCVFFGNRFMLGIMHFNPGCSTFQTSLYQCFPAVFKFQCTDSCYILTWIYSSVRVFLWWSVWRSGACIHVF